MKASEVTKLVEQRIHKINEIDQRMYDKVIYKITSNVQAAKEPMYSTDIYENLSKAVIAKLREDGFGVGTEQGQNGESYFNVSWPRPTSAEDYYNK
jgi:hypothetical protein